MARRNPSLIETNEAVWRAPETVLEWRGKHDLQPDETAIFARYGEGWRDGRVLDAGCGAGRTTGSFLALTDRYVGVDSSEAMIRACQQRFPGAHFVRCDMRRMDCFAAGAFDLAFAGFNALDYLDQEGRLTALAEFFRVLGTPGMFIFSSHNRRFERARTEPRFAWSMNPLELARNGKRYLLESRNHHRHRRREVHEAEYAILNDRAHRYGLLTYYIDKEGQVEQLRRVGFGVREMLDAGGVPVRPGVPDAHSAWINYVAVKG